MWEAVLSGALSLREMRWWVKDLQWCPCRPSYTPPSSRRVQASRSETQRPKVRTLFILSEHLFFSPPPHHRAVRQILCPCLEIQRTHTFLQKQHHTLAATCSTHAERSIDAVLCILIKCLQILQIFRENCWSSCTNVLVQFRYHSQYSYGSTFSFLSISIKTFLFPIFLYMRLEVTFEKSIGSMNLAVIGT